MQNYYAQTNVTETITNNYGTQVVVNPMALAHFKHAVESQLIGLTAEIQTMKSHASWIEPRLNDYHKFMEWMQRVHPDVITAYTEATKVEKVLDAAQGDAERQSMEASA